jgi:hypothetical protein
MESVARTVPRSRLATFDRVHVDGQQRSVRRIDVIERETTWCSTAFSVAFIEAAEFLARERSTATRSQRPPWRRTAAEPCAA